MRIKHYYLITNYNLQQYLPNAFNSIISQYSNLDFFYERAVVLLSDDCSTEPGAEEIIQKISLQHKNFKYWIQEENIGVGANKSFLLDQARNLGLKPQDLVTFLDADDMLSQNCMLLRLEAMDQDLNVNAVGGQILLFTEENSNTVDTFYVDPDLAKIANIFECQLYGSNCTFRGEVFLPNNNFPAVGFSDDWMFCALNKINFTHIPQVTLQYRRHENNNTNNPSNGLPYEYRKFIRNLQLVDLGIILTDKENQLLDKIGFLVFRQEIKNDLVIFREDIHMPWFSVIPRGEPLRQIQIEFENFQKKLISQNDLHSVYDSRKLATFLKGITSQLYRIEDIYTST